MQLKQSSQIPEIGSVVSVDPGRSRRTYLHASALSGVIAEDSENEAAADLGQVMGGGGLSSGLFATDAKGAVARCFFRLGLKSGLLLDGWSSAGRSLWG